MSITLEEYERIQPNVNFEGILFNVPNKHCLWRVETIYTKEPDTVEWINSLPPGDVFYDIGANVGIYTMLAVRRGLKVFAFEPEAQNFAVLVRNLAMNNVSKDKAVAFPFAISNGNIVNTLRLQSLMAGGSCHSFGSDLNYKMEEKQWAYEQGSVGFSLYSLVFEMGLPQPKHIKVDVDGFENEVLEGLYAYDGGSGALDDVDSILVEMDSNNEKHMHWKRDLEELGFKTEEDQINKARRKEGPFTGIGNIIFKR